MDQILVNIADIIQEYEGGSWNTPERLREILRLLSSNVYHLTKFNIEAFNRHNTIQYAYDGSVAAGKILADEKVPELRMTRKILEASQNVVWSMRSELSILKSEQ